MPEVQLTVVLYVAVRADTNGAKIPKYRCSRPDIATGADDHVADDARTRVRAAHRGLIYHCAGTRALAQGGGAVYAEREILGMPGCSRKTYGLSVSITEDIWFNCSRLELVPLVHVRLKRRLFG